MLGKKKKQDEQASSEPNELDKPQTLAELDAMAREKKDDKVMLDDGDGEVETDASSKEPEHEVVHNDEHTVDTNVRKVTSSQRKLQALVGFAVMLLIFGGVMFYSQIEDGAVGVGAGGSEEIAPVDDTEVNDLLPRGTYAYAAGANASSYNRFNVDDSSAQDVDLGGSIAAGGESEPFQLSSNSLVSATRTSGGIVVKVQEESQTFFAEQIGSISDWLLVPDGTRVFALIGSSLHGFDTTTGVGGELAKDFAPGGADRSALNYGRDGSISMYAKQGGLLTGSIFNLESAEVTSVEKEVTRLENMGPFNDSSVSPDGISIVFIANINGNQTLQLLSLNSFVLRTIYVAEAGNVPDQFTWSDDSNNIIIYETGAAPLIANLKVGTLEKEVILENTVIEGGLSWAPDKSRAAFIQGGTLKAVTIESKEVTDLISSVSADASTGWFQN